MTLWKQAVLAGAVAVGAIMAWAAFVPSAAPLLAQLGLLDPLQRIGIAASTGPEEGAPADGSGSARAPGGGGSAGGGFAVAGPATVIAAPVDLEPMNDVVTAIGSGQAVRSVLLAPEVAGRLDALHVASGDYVEAGTVVAELEASAARIAVDRAALMLSDAQATADRLARLQSSGAATDLQIQDAALAVKTAELELREAEFDLTQRRIVAPISGWVGILGVEVGDQVSVGTEITRIDDRSSLLVDFRVPERVVGRLSVGQPLTAVPLADSAMTLEGRISALDNRVDEASRTLRVQADIDNEADRLRAGMAFSITLSFTGDSLPAVDPLAIQWGDDGAFVWVVREGKADRLPVRILQRNSDAVLLRAEFAPGDLVVTEGVQGLRPGAEVAVAPLPDAARGTAEAATAPKI